MPGVTIIVTAGALRLKSDEFVPERASAVIDKFALPVFIIVTGVAALLLPTGTEPNDTLAGFKLTQGPMPVPDNGTDCGLLLALSVMISVAERAPGAAGVKVTLTMVLPLGATVIGSVPEVMAKSPEFVPVIVKAEIVRFPVPGFEIVTGIAVLAVLIA